MPLFAITGITGHVGRAAARRLLAGGAGVRAVVRDEAKAAPWRKLGAEFAVASLLSRRSSRQPTGWTPLLNGASRRDRPKR